MNGLGSLHAKFALTTHILDAGYPFNANTLINVFVGGSQLHGAKVSGYDDLDIYGCYIEPPEYILGIMMCEHFVWSSSSDAVKNSANDIDVTTYSLHRWGELMMKGNPAILHYLFAVNDSIGSDTWARYIAPIKESLVTLKSAKQYIGFANSQRMRLTGERGMGRHGQRPDLIEQYGFDTKFAMHYIRLLLECLELLRSRNLTFPLAESKFLIDIRTGKYTQAEVFKYGAELMLECEDAMKNSSLPESINPMELSRVIAQAYKYHWDNFRGIFY